MLRTLRGCELYHKAAALVRDGQILEKVNHMEALMHREMQLMALQKLRKEEIHHMQERSRRATVEIMRMSDERMKGYEPNKAKCVAACLWLFQEIQVTILAHDTAMLQDCEAHFPSSAPVPAESPSTQP